MSIAHHNLRSPYCPRAIRIHIVRRAREPDAGHPFLHHAWCAPDSDRGIAWGVLAAPSIRNLLGVVQGQRVEQEIRYPRYLIGATGEGAQSLRRAPSEPLPVRELIFLYGDDDIRTWLLANDGQDPMDLLVLESRLGDAEDYDETPEPPNGRYPFFDRKVWDRSKREGDEEEDSEEDSAEDSEEDSEEDETEEDEEVEGEENEREEAEIGLRRRAADVDLTVETQAPVNVESDASFFFFLIFNIQLFFFLFNFLLTL